MEIVYGWVSSYGYVGLRGGTLLVYCGWVNGILTKAEKFGTLMSKDDGNLSAPKL